MITRNSIAAKLGFDPLNPPEWCGEPDVVDDHTPSIWSPLNDEERMFVYELMTGKK